MSHALATRRSPRATARFASARFSTPLFRALPRAARPHPCSHATTPHALSCRLCESEQYATYMQQNCRASCADPSAAMAAGGARDAATEPTPANCLMWARGGMCKDGASHKEYMDLHCSETCANLEEVSPSGSWR